MTKRHRQLATQLAQLDGQRQALLKEGAQISDRAEQEKRGLTAEERTRRDQILTELDELKPQIDATESEIQAEIKLEDHEKGQIASAATRSPATVRQVDAEFGGFGEFLQAVAMQSDMSLRYSLGPKAKVLDEKLGNYQAAGSGMSVGSPADGGFLVRKDWSTAMLDRASQQAVLLPRTRQIPVGGDFDGLEYPYIDESSRVDGSRWGGVQVFWKAEAATVTAMQP
jgi:HK97 family phage major capsid protein